MQPLSTSFEGSVDSCLFMLRLQSCSLSTLQARLKVAAHQAEEESEDRAENFLEGRTDIDEFLTGFMEKRTVRPRPRAVFRSRRKHVGVVIGSKYSRSKAQSTLRYTLGYLMFVLPLSYATAEEQKRRSSSSPSTHTDSSQRATRRYEASTPPGGSTAGHAD